LARGRAGEELNASATKAGCGSDQKTKKKPEKSKGTDKAFPVRASLARCINVVYGGLLELKKGTPKLRQEAANSMVVSIGALGFSEIEASRRR